MQWYLTEAGAAPRQWECWGEEAGSGTAGEIPSMGALTVTHPGGETRPRGYWIVRAPPIFHTELFWCTHLHTHKVECTHSPALHIKTKFILTALSPFCSELKYFTSSKSILVHWSVCMPCSKPWETIHHANQAVSQVKMNWLWVRAMRGRAYGSDEAENWPQKKTESEKETKTEKGREGERKRKRKRGGWRKTSI